MKLPQLKTEPQKATRSVSDTIEFTRDEAAAWPLPHFQRAKNINAKVRLLAEVIKSDGGVIPGTLLFGVLKGKLYLLDGQHRRESFLMSGHETGYADVRTQYFDDEADMGQAYVIANSRLANWRPDDTLRAMEAKTESLQLIRAGCPWVGYDMIRRSDTAPLLSMSAVLRWWIGSQSEVPKGPARPVQECAEELHREEVNQLIGFLASAMQAWGRDIEFQRLWGALNLTLCMWLYRRMVIGQHSPKTTKLSLQTFKNALAALSADELYTDWLLGRALGERNRAPAYRRITAVMAKRVLIDGVKKPLFPAPPWSLGTKAR